MTRFWITLDQAVDLVVRAFCQMQGGEIFVPRIPSMKITDLAEAVAPDCEVINTGIRPGEKLHEVLITEEEGRHAVSYEGMYVILPNYPWWERQNYKGGDPLPENFSYVSNSNDQWLSVGELRRMICGSSAEKDPTAQFLSTLHRLNEKVVLNMVNAEEGFAELPLAEGAGAR